MRKINERRLSPFLSSFLSLLSISVNHSVVISFCHPFRCFRRQYKNLLIMNLFYSLADPLENKSQWNFSTTSPAISITEYFDFFPSTCADRERTARMDMPSETNEAMEADIDL